MLAQAIWVKCTVHSNAYVYHVTLSIYTQSRLHVQDAL